MREFKFRKDQAKDVFRDTDYGGTPVVNQRRPQFHGGRHVKAKTQINIAGPMQAKDAASLRKFRSFAHATLVNWRNLTVDQRRDGLAAAVDSTLMESGIPPLEGVEKDNTTYMIPNFWKLSLGLNDTLSITYTENVVLNCLHEIRHFQQFFAAARYFAGHSTPSVDLARRTAAEVEISESAANVAICHAIGAGHPDEPYGKFHYDQIGKHGAHTKQNNMYIYRSEGAERDVKNAEVALEVALQNVTRNEDRKAAELRLTVANKRYDAVEQHKFVGYEIEAGQSAQSAQKAGAPDNTAFIRNLAKQAESAAAQIAGPEYQFGLRSSVVLQNLAASARGLISLVRAHRMSSANACTRFTEMVVEQLARNGVMAPKIQAADLTAFYPERWTLTYKKNPQTVDGLIEEFQATIEIARCADQYFLMARYLTAYNQQLHREPVLTVARQLGVLPDAVSAASSRPIGPTNPELRAAWRMATRQLNKSEYGPSEMDRRYLQMVDDVKDNPTMLNAAIRKELVRLNAIYCDKLVGDYFQSDILAAGQEFSRCYEAGRNR